MSPVFKWEFGKFDGILRFAEAGKGGGYLIKWIQQIGRAISQIYIYDTDAIKETIFSVNKNYLFLKYGNHKNIGSCLLSKRIKEQLFGGRLYKIANNFYELWLF